MRDLSLHLLDIIQNSLKAGASRIEVRIDADLSRDRLSLQVIDNGSGMDTDLLSRVTDPFVTTRTTRSVGLGIPLFREAATITGGSFTIDSTPGIGTKLQAEFVLSNVDRLPLGDLADTFVGLVLSDPTRTYVIAFSAGEKRFDLDLDEIRQQLIDVPLNDINVLDWLQELIEEQQRIIFGGVLYEVSC
jgi:hypothetical protein